MQQVIALSSAESELCARVRTSIEGIGVQNIAMDMGITCGVILYLDSSAALANVKVLPRIRM